jgi:hypothetical protein
MKATAPGPMRENGRESVQLAVARWHQCGTQLPLSPRIASRGRRGGRGIRRQHSATIAIQRRRLLDGAFRLLFRSCHTFSCRQFHYGRRRTVRYYIAMTD